MKKVNVIYRNENIINQIDDLELLHTYKKFPIFIGCTYQKPSRDIFENMSWYISRSSGIIQLNPLIPIDILYKTSHGAGTVGKIWENHHHEFSNFIKKYHPKNILEIGGGNGTLSQKYVESENETSWTIIDPNVHCQHNKSIKTIRKFFDDNFISNQSYDTILYSHVLEHVYDPNIFLQHISSFSKNGTLMIFSIPNMKPMLEKKYTNCINFEHTIFITEPYIEYLMSKYNFKIIEKSYFLSDHSIFYCVKKTETSTITPLQNELYKTNKQIFFNYVNYYNNYIKRLNEKIKTIKTPIFLFGAHIFSQFLISCGLDTTKIISILDNDNQKQNKRLYGTKFNIDSPTMLKNINSPTIILKAGIYNNEIKQNIRNNINKNVSFL